MPYIGLKTEQALNMFSNLYTEKGRTNHVVIRDPWYLFELQTDTVRIVETDVPYFRWLQEHGLEMTYFTLRSKMSDIKPWFERERRFVTYGRGGRIHSVRAGEQAPHPDVFEPCPDWLRKIFDFRLIRADGTKPHCSSHKPGPDHVQT